MRFRARLLTQFIQMVSPCGGAFDYIIGIRRDECVGSWVKGAGTCLPRTQSVLASGGAVGQT